MRRETDEEAAPLHLRVGVYEFLDDGVFVCKNGQIGKVYALAGRDGECLDDSEIDEFTQAWERVMGLLDENFTLYQYLIRWNNEIKLFIVPLCAAPGFKVSQWSAEKEIRHHRAKRLAQFNSLTSVSRSSAEQAGCLAPLNQQETFRFLRLLLNFSDEKRTLILNPSRPDRLDEQIVDTDIEGWEDHLRADNHHVKAMTLTNAAPEDSNPMMFCDLLGVDANFHVVTEWRRFKDSSAVVRKQADFMWKMRISIFKQMANAASSSAGKENAKPEERKNKAQLENVDELDTAVADIQNRGLTTGEFSLSVVVYDESREKMERAATEIKTVFARREFHLFEERHNLFRCLWATVPGGSCFQRRRLKLMNTNAADYSLIWKPDTGDASNVHLKSPNLLTLETRQKTSYGFNFHVGQVGHAEIIGQSGSGKSYLLKAVMHSLQEQYNAYVVAFVMGGGFEFLIRHLGGVYCALGRGDIDRGRLPFKLNPFACEATDDNVEFVQEFVRLKLEQDSEPLTAEQVNDVDVQVQSLFMLPAAHRRLSNLMLDPKELQPRLARWVHGFGSRPDGKYAWLFDNEEDTLQMSDFHCFDLDGMDERPALTEVLMFYLLHQVNRQVFSRDISRLKVIIIDEAWAFFRNALFQEAMKKFLKTARKRNGIVVFATQSLDDLEQCRITGVLKDSCLTKVLLANPGLDREKYKAWFGLKDKELDLLTVMEPGGPMLVKKPRSSKVGILRVDKRRHWLYLDEPDLNAKRAEMVEKHGDRWLEQVLVEAT
jgi:type IV secretion system protein VirB4